MGAKMRKHDLAVISGHIRLCYPGLSVCVESGQKDGGLYLGGGYFGGVMDAMKSSAPDREGSPAIASPALDLGAHKGKRLYDAPHRSFPDGGVPGQGHREILSRQDAADQPHGSPAVAAVQI